MTVYLPAVDEPTVAASETPTVPQRGNGECILLVDDEEPMQELGKELLEELGYRVLIAGDGSQAVEIYRKQSDEIKLVILDLIMPGMDGGQTYVEMKKINHSVKAVFCSGFTSEKVITDLLKEEHLRAIQKPFHPADFVRIVQEVLSGR